MTNDGVLSIRMSEKYRVVSCRALKPKILHKDPAHPLVLPLTCLLQSEKAFDQLADFSFFLWFEDSTQWIHV